MRLLLIALLLTAATQEQAATRIRQGDGYRSSRQYDRAIVEYSEAIRLDPRSTEAYFNRGLAFEAIGSDRNALEDFSAVIRLNRKDARALERRATVHFRMGAYDRSAGDYEAALAVDARNAQALYGRAVVRRVRRKETLATTSSDRDIADATALDPDIAAEMAARGVK